MNCRRHFFRSSALQLAFGFCLGGVILFVPGVTPAQQSSESSPTSASARPNLSGTWTLNKDLSDDPRQKMQQGMGSAGGSGGGGGGWQGGRGRGGGTGGSGGGMMQELSQLKIDQTDASVKITGASGRLITQTAENSSSGSGPSAQSGQGDGAQFSPPIAQWQGNKLVSVTEGRRGGKTTRTYELSPQGNQLVVTTKIENERLNTPVTIRQVYDPAKAGATSSQ
jgi:hypothetical protein